MAERLRVAAFPSAGELALHAADALGLFARAGLDVEIADVRGSGQQFERLRDGRSDVLHTAADNVLARRAEGLDVAIVAGVNRGLLSLVAADGASIEDLRGRRVGVDSARSGYAVVLRHLLAGAGLAPEQYELVEVGGTRERARALAAGAIAATLLTPPYDVLALRDGCRRLARPTDAVPRYLGATVAVPRAWAREHPDLLERYLGALLAAGAWIRHGGDRTEVLALVRERTGAPEELAGEVLEAALDPGSGLLPEGRVEAADVEAVAALRRAAGLPTAGDDCLEPAYLER